MDESPRIAFAYHFYVEIPLICLCNAIVLQQIWEWVEARGAQGPLESGAVGVVAYVVLVVAAFIFFYPILAGTCRITWDAWNARMWI